MPLVLTTNAFVLNSYHSWNDVEGGQHHDGCHKQELERPLNKRFTVN
jgi:hypothetical protein